MCDPLRKCVAASLPLEQQQVAAERGFGPRGAELWSAMEGLELGPAHRVLLVEACRLADRLDRFDRVLTGGKWFFDRRDDDDRVEVVIDAVLSEARQHAQALKALVSELEPRPKVGSSPVPQVNGGAGIADLAARIAARRSGAGA